MDSINLSDSGLATLPDLSSFVIKRMDVRWNQIQMLWEGELPMDVEELNLEGNSLGTDGLLAIWPASLKILNLSRNNFWSLDHVLDWPHSLRVLNLSKTDLSILDCSSLPSSLEDLNISYTLLTTLSKFPVNLKKFTAESTKITALPSRCPDTLETLIFSATRVPVSRNCLPNYWGTSLKFLDLNSNGLKQIPNSLPATLEYVNFYNNHIQEIPPKEKFPMEIRMLHLGNNRIRVIPPWFSELRKMKFTVQNNLLIIPPIYSHCLIFHSQFIGMKFLVAAQKIQRVWRRQKIPPAIRTWKRTSNIKNELLEQAMCPARAGRFEDISSEWNYVYNGP